MRLTFRLLVLILVFTLNLLVKAQDRFEIITVENASQLVEIQTWTDTNGDFSPATFSSDGSKLAIVLNNGQVEIISTKTIQTEQIIEGIKIEAEWLTFSADGTELLLSNRTGAYTLIDLDTGELLAENTIADEQLAFSPTADVRKFVQWDYFDSAVGIYNIVTGEELLSVEHADIWRTSYDGRLLLTRDFNYTVEVWDIDKAEVIFTLTAPDENVLRDGLSEAGFTPDGLVWATFPKFSETENGSIWSNPIQFWDMETGQMVMELGETYNHYRAVRSVVYDPTSSYVLAWILSESGGQQCTIWNISTKDELLCPAGGNYSAIFSADGQLIATYSGTSLDVAIRSVDPPSRPIMVLESEYPWFTEFSPDGQFLITIDRYIHLWGIPISDS